MAADPSTQATLDLLRTGEVEVKGRMPWSSNGTFLVEICADGEATLAIYKPGHGERPLWDFPRGLYRREAAAWALSEGLGWSIVPETLVRDGPFGEGSVQRFVEADFEEHYFTLYADERHHSALRTICTFDLLVNNTDRKSGHCLVTADGNRIFAIDNGLCFHPDPKVRTVIWEFAGQEVPTPLLDDVARTLPDLAVALAPFLDDVEIGGVRRRAQALLADPVFPGPDPSGHCYPWPLV